MTDDNDSGRSNPAQGGRAPLTLKPRLGGSVSAGMVKQSFSHGRSKTVVVETTPRAWPRPPWPNGAEPSRCAARRRRGRKRPHSPLRQPGPRPRPPPLLMAFPRMSAALASG